MTRVSFGRFVVALSVVLTMTASVRAQVPGEEWERILVLDISTNVVAVDRNFQGTGAALAGTAGRGIWRTTDGGSSWEQSTDPVELTHARITDIALSPGFDGDETAYVLTRQGAIYKSTDVLGSFTFTRVLAPPDEDARGAALAISPDYLSDPVVFAGYNGDGLYLTTNGGSSWTGVPSAMTAIQALAISPTFSVGVDERLYVGGQSNDTPIFRRIGVSTGSWEKRQTPSGSNTEIISTLLLRDVSGAHWIWCGTEEHGMWRSTDGGGIWSAGCDGNSTASLPRVNALARSDNNITLLEGRSDDLYESTDDGATCSSVPPHLTINDVEYQPAWNGTNRCIIFIATPSGLFRKTCATGLGEGPGEVDGWDITVADSFRGFYMGSRGHGLFKTGLMESTGQFTMEMARYNAFPNRLVPEIVAVGLNPAYDQTLGTSASSQQAQIYVGANFSSAPFDNGVYKSTDHGNSWTHLTSNWPTISYPEPPIVVYDMQIPSSYNETSGEAALFAGTNRGLYMWNHALNRWVDVWSRPDAPIFAIGLSPAYQYQAGAQYPANPNEMVFVATIDAAGNPEIWYHRASGEDTRCGCGWIKTGYDGAALGMPTAFAFERAFGSTGQEMVYVSTDGTGTTLDLEEEFDSASFPPGAWRVIDNSGAGVEWDSSDALGVSNMTVESGGSGFSAAAAPKVLGPNNWDTSLVSPLIDLQGATNPILTFVSNFQVESSGEHAYVIVDDGSSTSTLLHLTSSNPSSGRFYSFDLSGFVGQKITIIFRYISTPASGYFWHVDNVRVAEGALGGVYMASDGIPWIDWVSRSSGLGSYPLAVWDVATEPGFDPGSSEWMLAAADSGAFFTDSGGIWWESSRDAKNNPMPPALSVAYDLSDPQGTVVGLQKDGAAYSTNRGVDYEPFTGYHYVPNDVWSTVAHERDPDVVFFSSESLGVFVSTDGGLSARPINHGRGGALGPPFITSGLGLNMLTDRRNFAGLDIVWVGTADDGIKALFIYYDSATGEIDLESEDSGGTPNGWRHTRYTSTSGPIIPGRWERIEVVPYTAQAYPVWAVSQTSPTTAAQGAAQIQAGPWWTVFLRENTGLPASLETKGVRHAYGSPITLTDGVPVPGDVDNNEWDYYVIDVPAGSTDLNLFMSDLGGDADLYVRKGALPDLGSWDYRPYHDGDETVCINETILSEDFEGSWGPYGDNPPPGWLILDFGDESPKVWNTNDWHRHAEGGSYGNVARMYYTPAENSLDELRTSAFNFPSDATAASLEFDHDFNLYASNEYGRVWFLSDQRTVMLAEYSTDTGWTHASFDLTSYLSDTNARAVFQYEGNFGWWWKVDNVEVKVTRPGTPLAGTWYIGINGWASGNSTYELTATLDSGCVAPLVAMPPRKESDGSGRKQGPVSRGITASLAWGTINDGSSGGGVFYYDNGTWTARNGTGATALPNLEANTVLQLDYLTVIAGCSPSALGSLFVSPSPDQGLTTWIDVTGNVADDGSNDFRDLLAASNGDVLVAANGTGTGSNKGGVWLSGDRGRHWMNISEGFDASTQKLEDLVNDSGAGGAVQYYASTDATGVYTRTITAAPYPVVSTIVGNSGPADGGQSVTVTGMNFSDSCPTGVSSDCPANAPMVIFGDTEVTGTWVNATTINATTPAHLPGSVPVRVRNPDTRQSGAGPSYLFSCMPPDVAPAPTAADISPYAFTGVQLTWDVDPGDWGDGQGDVGTYDVLRDGAPIGTGLEYGTTSLFDTSGVGGVLYSYQIRYNNGCGLSNTSGTAPQKDDAEAAAEPGKELKWSDTVADQLEWGNTIGAATYKIYRGSSDDLPDLAGSGGGDCLVYEGAGRTATDADVPPAGELYWYLVVATKAGGEGTPGAGSTTNRTIAGGLGPCP